MFKMFVGGQINQQNAEAMLEDGMIAMDQRGKLSDKVNIIIYLVFVLSLKIHRFNKVA